jgi:hypothetical protein
MFEAVKAPSMLMHWEAISALRSLCEHHFPVLQPHWASVSAMVRACALQATAPPASAPGSDAANGQAPRTGSSDAPRARPPLRVSQAGEGYAASMAEKVANQALRLAGDFMRQSHEHLSAGAAEAASGTAAELSQLAQSFLTDMLTHVRESPSPAIHSAAFATTASLPAGLWDRLSPQAVSEVLAAATKSAQADGNPAVRSNALKALEATLSVRALLALPIETAAAIEAIAAAFEDSASSVKISASGAVAACATSVRALVHDDARPSGAQHGASELEASDVSARTRADDPGSESACGEEGSMPVAGMMSATTWGALRRAILAAAVGGDKLRINGMRAVGGLGSLLPLERSTIGPDVLRCYVSHDAGGLSGARRHADSGTGDAGSGAVEWEGWLERAADAVIAALSKGSSKSAWNAAVAAGQLVGRADALADSPSAVSVLARLPPELASVVRNSANFKARIHATRALCASHASRPLFPGDGLATAVGALAAARCALDAEPDSAAAPEASAASAQDAADAESSAADFRYREALQDSLGEALRVFVAALRPHDVTVLVGLGGAAALVAALRLEVAQLVEHFKAQQFEQVWTAPIESVAECQYGIGLNMHVGSELANGH